MGRKHWIFKTICWFKITIYTKLFKRKLWWRRKQNVKPVILIRWIVVSETSYYCILESKAPPSRFLYYSGCICLGRQTFLKSSILNPSEKNNFWADFSLTLRGRGNSSVKPNEYSRRYPRQMPPTRLTQSIFPFDSIDWLILHFYTEISIRFYLLKTSSLSHLVKGV